MEDLVLLPLLIRDNNLFPSTLGQTHRSSGSLLEVASPNLPPVYESERKTIGKHGTQLLHEVKSERWPAWAKCVKEPDLRIETGALRGRRVNDQVKVDHPDD